MVSRLMKAATPASTQPMAIDATASEVARYSAELGESTLAVNGTRKKSTGNLFPVDPQCRAGSPPTKRCGGRC